MILAGITLFNPDVARLEENISSIYGQVDRVICVDNGSDNIKSIEDCVLKNWKNITIIKNISSLIKLIIDIRRHIKWKIDNLAIRCDSLIDLILFIFRNRSYNGFFSRYAYSQ